MNTQTNMSVRMATGDKDCSNFRTAKTIASSSA